MATIRIEFDTNDPFTAKAFDAEGRQINMFRLDVTFQDADRVFTERRCIADWREHTATTQVKSPPAGAVR